MPLLRFVGWISNFIHNRNAVNVNMLRGWSTSTFSHAVSTDVVRAVGTRLSDRGLQMPKRGFLLDSSARMDKRRKVTVKGGGEIALIPHSRNSRRLHSDDNLLTDCPPLYSLPAAVASHARQLAVPHVLSNRLLCMWSGVYINGRPWPKGSLCFYFLPTDRTITALPRVGVVLFFVVEVIGREQHVFACVDQRVVVDRQLSIVTYDVRGPAAKRYVHVDHLTHLAGSVPYWHAGRPDIRMAVPIGTTF